MAYRIKETLQIKVDYIFVTVRDDGFRSLQRIVASTIRAEAEAAAAKLLLIDRSQDLVNGLLNQTVYNCRYAQQSLLAIILGYLYPSDGIRTVAAVHEALYQSVLVGSQPREQLLA